DVFKNAFSGGGAQPVNVPGGGYEVPTSATELPTAPQEGVPLRTEVAQPGAELPQLQGPAVLPSLGQARDALVRGNTDEALNQLDQAREAVATSAVGPALGMLRGPALLSDQEVLAQASPDQVRTAERFARLGQPADYQPTDTDVAEQLRNMQVGIAYAGTHVGPGGAPVAAGAEAVAPAPPRLGLPTPGRVPREMLPGTPPPTVGPSWDIQAPPSLTDKLQQAWYAGILSNPLTHIRNVAGNAGALAYGPLESGAAATIEALSTLGGIRRPRERFFGEVPAEIAGTAAALPGALRDAYEVLRRGPTAANLRSGQVPREAFSGRLADLTVNVPGRSLGAGDTLFGSLNEGASIYKEAYRIASQEGLRGGELADRVVDLIQRPTENMLKNAAGERAYRTFQQPSEVVEKLTEARNAIPGAVGVVPFIKTPYNIAKYVLERSPAGLVKMATDPRGGGAASDRLGRMAVGTATMGYFYNLAQQGLVTGAPPKSDAERDAWKRMGKTPYSVKIGDTWHSYSSLQPLSGLLAAGAAASDAVQNGEDADAQTLLLTSGIALGRSLVDSQWTTGLSDFLDLLNDPQTRDPETALASLNRFGQRQVGSLVPAIVRGIAQASDPTVRKPEST
ncbi:MAG TPA: hypothetical protein VFG86_03800, partial [Chloroflexota bacterium]|nr:hypothetical protein [Chloroflexota bacterium]